MNILPLVFTFLIIFALIAVTFLKEVKSFSLIETAIHGYNRTERMLSNRTARKEYGKIRVDSGADKPKKEKVLKKYSSMRSLFPPLENSKFNLRPLIKQEGTLKLHPLYEPLASLLRVLYEEKLFKKSEGVEYKLLDEILKKAQKFPDTKVLAELYPEDPALRKIFYKMLKGTNQYSRKKGIAPLGSFLFLGKEDKALFLSFSSPEILEALFEKEISLEILKSERAKWEESKNYYYFSKEDFQNIIMNKALAKSTFFTSLEPFIDYSKQFMPRDLIAGRDQITGIAVEKLLN